MCSTGCSPMHCASGKEREVLGASRRMTRRTIRGELCNEQGAARMRVRFRRIRGDHNSCAGSSRMRRPAATTEHLLVRPATRPGLRQPRRSCGVRQAGPDGRRNLRRGPQDVPAIQSLCAAEDHQAVGRRELRRLEPGAGRSEDRVTVGQGRARWRVGSFAALGPRAVLRFRAGADVRSLALATISLAEVVAS